MSKSKLMSKIKLRIIAGASGLLVILGLSLGSRALQDNQTKPPINTDEDTKHSYSDTIGTAPSQVESDIYTVAPEDPIDTSDIYFEDYTTNEQEITVKPGPIPEPGDETLPIPDQSDTIYEETLTDPTTETIEEDTIEIVDPIEDKQEIKENYQNLITHLNIRIKDYLDSKNNGKRPTISGIEVLNVTEGEDAYNFNIKLEGAYEGQGISYFNLSIKNNGIEGANIYDLSSVENINLKDLLSQLDDLIISQNTEILSIKNLSEVTIENKEKAIQSIGLNLTSQQIKNAQINAYVMTNVLQASKGNYTYENKIVITSDNQTYFTTLTVNSTKPLTSTKISEYISQFLNGETVENIKFDYETTVVSQNKINKYFDEINNMVEEESLSQ